MDAPNWGLKGANITMNYWQNVMMGPAITKTVYDQCDKVGHGIPFPTPAAILRNHNLNAKPVLIMTATGRNLWTGLQYDRKCLETDPVVIYFNAQWNDTTGECDEFGVGHVCFSTGFMMHLQASIKAYSSHKIPIVNKLSQSLNLDSDSDDQNAPLVKSSLSCIV